MTKKDKEKALEVLLGFKKRAEKLSKKLESIYNELLTGMKNG